MTVILLVVAGLAAVADWVVVDRGLFRLEYAFKPATLLLLLAAAVTADLGPPKLFVVAALALSLVGDIAIMLADPDEVDTAFRIGLVAFLVAHVVYIVGFVRLGVHLLPFLAGLLVVAGIGGLTLPAALRRAAADGGAVLAGAVAAYGVSVAGMAAVAVGTQYVAVAIGGVLFVVSDALIAREMFVARVPRGPLLVAVTYHLAQFLIVIGLLATA